MIRAFLTTHKRALVFLGATWGLYFTYLFTKVMQFRPDGLYMGNGGAWSDWALHVGLTNIFATKSPVEWFAYHPIFADGQLTYPFATNLISGLLIKAGVSLQSAFIVPSLVFMAVFLFGGYALFYKLLKSRKQAVAALSFFFLSAGWGIAKYVDQAKQAGSLVFPSGWNSYTSLGQYEWYSGNVVDGMLVPQRAFLMGLAVSMIVLVGFLTLLERKNTTKTKISWILLGLLAGCLPVIHAHSFIVVGSVTGVMALAYWRLWRQWIWYAFPAVLLSAYLYLHFIRGGIQVDNFMSWQPLWTANGFTDWVHQWWLQWGLMLPVVIAGFWVGWKRWDKPARIFFVVMVALFVIANLVVFQPVRWDNSKVFVWVYFGFSGIAAWFVAWLWHRIKKTGPILAILVILGLSITGLAEVCRLAHLVTTGPARLSSSEEIQAGEFVRLQTDSQARFATAPSHNHFVMMWGARPVLLGYTAWAWNFGFEYQQTEADLHTIYSGSGESEGLLESHDVSYIVISLAERRAFKLNESYFALKYPVVYKSETIVIYDVRS